MQWSDGQSPAELQRALAERRFKDAHALVKLFIADLESVARRVPADIASEVLSVLRSNAWFDLLYQVAERIERGGQKSTEVQLQLAQAAIEQGAVTAAIDTLLALRESLDNRLSADVLPAPESQRLQLGLGEVLGLLGRSYKQLYVDARPTATEPRTHDLQCSCDYYEESYKKSLGDYLWHGVNYVALLTHARRIETCDAAAYSDTAINHAETMLDAIKAKEQDGSLRPWDLANRAELLLACGDNRAAVEAVKAYLDAPSLNAFNVQSTRRQFVQLWLLNENEPPGALILPMMTARLAELGGSGESFELSPEALPKFEKVWGETSYQPLRWLQTALERAQCVARLGPDMYEGWGTGFLLEGAWIDERFTGRNLLLTNAHVCSNDKAVQQKHPYPKGPEDNTAVFLAAASGEPVELAVRELLWTSPPSELDASLLEIDPPPEGAKAPPLARTLPSPQGDSARVNVIGHPRGLNVRVSLQDNQVVAVGDPYLHYRTPTDPGSSGSPVFDQAWNLVALHHASSSSMQANEGVRMDRLLEAMRKDLL